MGVANMSGHREVSAEEAMPADHFRALQELYGANPPGRFLKGHHGVTHFLLEETMNYRELSPSGRPRIAVLAHGLGTSHMVYDGPICKTLLDAGFRVLRYDFLGHGWSFARDTFLRYDEGVFVAQIADLLDYILAPGEPVDLWVGHSTGGVVGVLTAAAVKEHPIREMALISPAFWVQKKFVARLGDRMPDLVHRLVKNVPFLQILPKSAYMENCDEAFGKRAGKYVFERQHELTREKTSRMLQMHPQVTGAILGIVGYFLRDDLLSIWRERFRDLLSSETDAPRVGLIWGELDTVVPFKHLPEAQMWADLAGNSGCVAQLPVAAGHESPVEDPELVARTILGFVRPVSRI